MVGHIDCRRTVGAYRPGGKGPIFIVLNKKALKPATNNGKCGHNAYGCHPFWHGIVHVTPLEGTASHQVQNQS